MFRGQMKFKLYAYSLILILLFVLNTSVTGQNALYGVVLAKDNHNPVTDACELPLSVNDKPGRL